VIVNGTDVIAVQFAVSAKRTELQNTGNKRPNRIASAMHDKVFMGTS
jgi:hypothetical protein